MTRTPAPELSPAEAARVAAFDAAPVPPEVAAVQYIVWGDWLVLDTGRHNCGVGPDGHYGAHEPGCGLEPVERVSVLLEVLAPVIAALPPSPARQAVERVEALLARWEDETREWYYANRYTHENGIEYVAGYEDGWNFADEQIRAALASPAPAPQGEEGR